MEVALIRNMSGPASKSNEGFSLIELLVVIGIVAILASIAIPQFAAYKGKAVDADMQSALQAGRQAIEAYYVQDQSYVGADVPTLTSSFGYKESPNVTLTMPPPTANHYILCVQSTGGTTPYYIYDSDVGISAAVSTCP
jgi:prepilin-type N-terminal cleavage/methylation domain-containing protein